jgi:hypothetical protein
MLYYGFGFQLFVVSMKFTIMYCNFGTIVKINMP